ncbi:Helix-turn-helix [Daejeonella lutea]|uniref:Helix-turn-helix n=1 Tax=Daejeonella lutea TaxID=572036 RepID=A0A1T5CXP0_9SPHI|nr:Helix-turn-helix [Daejeonella lutea]
MQQHEDLYFTNLSYNLLRIRKERNLSQEDMATLCNVERSKIGKMENKRIDPRLTTLIALARGLNIDITELLKAPLEDQSQKNENGSN